jgi:hypothetical protein
MVILGEWVFLMSEVPRTWASTLALLPALKMVTRSCSQKRFLLFTVVTRSQETAPPPTTNERP